MADTTPERDLELWARELVRIGNRAVRRAQEESCKKGVPNVYSINGILYYELPSGEPSRTDPYRGEAGRANDDTR